MLRTQTVAANKFARASVWRTSAAHREMQRFALVLSLIVLAHEAPQGVASHSLSENDTPSSFSGESAPGCDWTSLGGSRFDLSPLQKTGSDYTGNDGAFFYYLNVCAPVVTQPDCLGASICCFTRTGTFFGTFGSWGASVPPPSPQWQLLDAAHPEYGVQVTFQNGRAGCGASGDPEKVVARFRCNVGGTVPETFEVAEDYAQCVIAITHTSPAACPVKAPGPVPAPKPISTALSGGSVVLVFAGVGTFLYVALGCIYRRRRNNARGCDACPHVACWRELGRLVCDGCVFSARSATMCVRRVCHKPESYVQL